MFSKTIKSTVAVLMATTMGACSVPSTGMYNISSGPAPSYNVTPYEEALTCYAAKISNEATSYISVGNIKDYTGKFSYEAAEGGYKVTQGGTLMVMGALGKLGNTVKQVERFDTAISDIELKLSGNKLLKEVINNNEVLRMPKQGQVIGSDYYIAGGITEVNYNIQSGGAETRIANIGGGARYYVMNIAVDLRLIDTKSLEIIKTVSLQKQVVGTEITAGTFRFFTDTLVDVNIGSKNQEPIQLGVRSALQAATLELVSGGVFPKVDATTCKVLAESGYSLGVVIPRAKPNTTNIKKD